MAEGNTGFRDANADGSEFNRMSFVFQQLMAKIAGATPVMVVKCTNAGTLSPVGFVDVVPQVNQIDGAGNAVSDAVVIYGLPYSRIQGGANAVIMDPQVGDLGWAVFCDRDITSFKENRAQSNPGSSRRFDMSDGIYLGGILNGIPTQYVLFNDDGIKVVSPTLIELDAPTVTINASTACNINGPTNIDGTVAQTGGDVSIADDATVGGGVTATGEVIGSVVHATGSGHNL